jgi:hypothetical protein
VTLLVGEVRVLADAGKRRLAPKRVQTVMGPSEAQITVANAAAIDIPCVPAEAIS